MDNCSITKLTANINYDTCSPTARAKAGIETTAVIINRSDIDFTALTQSGATVTNLSLKAGASGFKTNWVKNLGSVASEFTLNDSGLDSYMQSFSSMVFGQSAADIERIQELGNGEFIVVVETKWKGINNTSAFSIYGMESGLRKSSGTFVSNENDSAYLYTLSSVEGYGESFKNLVYLESSYTATKAKFDALFVD